MIRCDIAYTKQLTIGILYYTNVDISDIERFNEWWATGDVRNAMAPRYRRRPFDAALKALDYRQAVVLTGLRRVGKSTILYQLIKTLLQGVDRKKVLYFSFEEGGLSAKDVIEAYEREVLKKPLDEAGRVYLFLDEVQYSADWIPVVKRFYDLYPNVKFYLSGSSSLLISDRTVASLAGRFFFVEVHPMTFREFVEMKGIAGGEGTHPSGRLEPLFFDYLTKAGFPEIVDWEDGNKIAEYVTNSVLDRVILRDVPALYGSRDPLLRGRLLRSLVSSAGSMANVNELSREFGASRITVSRYLWSLESSFLLRSLSNYRVSSRSSSRKLKKYYPSTTSIIYATSRDAYERNRGALLETYVVNALKATHYYRKSGREIDVLLGGGKVAVEIKEKPDERDALRLLKVAGEVGAGASYIVSMSETARWDGVEVVPAYSLEWVLGPSTAS